MREVTEMKNRNIDSEMRLGFVVLIGVTAFVLSGCGTSESVNKTIMDVVNHYDGKPKPSDDWQRSCNYITITEVSGARYCWYQKGSDPQYTIWFFHGAGDSERVFEWSPFNDASYIDLERGLPSVNIVTISYGPVWAMTVDRDTKLKPADATVKVFESTIVPLIEARHRDHLAKHYVAMGHSQGGINVATLCAALPNMWSKCVLLNPMLPSCNPFDPWPICPTIFSPLAGLGPNFLIRANYSETEWQKNQPLVLLKKLKDREDPPKLFVTACPEDQFGLYAGPKAWSDRAKQLGLSSEWVPGRAGCDHFQWPAQEVLNFLCDP
jgi:pimeloyl-ACP methyl ester carboxylesterase